MIPGNCSPAVAFVPQRRHAMAFRFLNPEYRKAYQPIDSGYRPIPVGGLIRTAILVVVAVGATYFVANALQSRAEMKGQAILAAHPSDELNQTATVHATTPSEADTRYSSP
jgi:hypothetical protein